MKYLIVLGTLALILLDGCATQYQSVGLTGGFVEKQFSRNEFAVAFAGNGYTSGQRAIDLCMLRCAELTLGHGFQYFMLTQNNAGYDTSSAVTIGNYIPTGYGGGVMFSTTQTIPKPSVANRILCFRNKPTFTTEYFDAQNTFDDLSQKYDIHKEAETFPQFKLPTATIGIKIEIIKPRANYERHGGSTMPIREEKPILKIEGFTDASLAQKNGLKIGDEICEFDGVSIPDLSRFNELAANWSIGQIVQVSIRRNGDALVIPVKTVYNPALKFKPIKEIRCSGTISEKDVVVIEGIRPTIHAFPVAEYDDWENPLESINEIKPYLLSAAINNGANGILILNSEEEIKNIFPNADSRVGFMCSLLVVPKARLGVEFETGSGYENRRIVRRILGSEADTSGLHVGDNVLAVNGIDLVLDAPEATKDCMKWDVGQEVQVTITRDGKELTFPVKTVQNRL